MSQELLTQQHQTYIEGLLVYLEGLFFDQNVTTYNWISSNYDRIKNFNDEVEDIEFRVSTELQITDANIIDLYSNVSAFLIRAIISGEYISDNAFLDNLVKVKEFVSDYCEDFINNEEIGFQSVFVFSKFLSLIQVKVLNVLKTLFEMVERYHKIVSSTGVSASYDIIQAFSSKKNMALPSISKLYIDNLNLVLDVFYLDHVISEDKHYLESVSQVEKRLNHYSDTLNFYCFGVLNIKLNFLKQKWFFRKVKSIDISGENPAIEEVLLMDDDIVSFNDDVDFLQGNNIGLLPWINEIRDHYNIKGKIKKSLDFNDLPSKSFAELRQLLKFYKDVKKSENVLKLVIEELKRRAEVDSTYNINVLYGMNCLLALYVELNTDNSVIEKFYKEIKSFQEVKSLINFFADMLMLKVETKRYLYHIDNYSSNKEKSIEIISRIDIDELEKRYNSLVSLFHKSCKHNSFLFRLSYLESCITSDTSGIDKVYYHSSIFLPIAKGYNFNKIELIQKDIVKIRAYKISLDLLKEDIVTIGSIKDELKNTNLKIVEIVSLFTAVISFILGSVGAFSFIETFNQALLFIVLYGVCISIFVGLFILVNRGGKPSWKYIFVVVPYIFIGVLLWQFLLPNYQYDLKNKLNKKEEVIVNRKLDSLHKLNQIDLMKKFENETSRKKSQVN